MHPAESIRSAKSRALEGKRIVLGITGSIAAVESFEIARELIRHGAEVHAVMTPEAARLITPTTMGFATGHEVITELDWRVQHVSFFGDFPDKADLLLIAPCTANTLSKVALGIDDTPVTTMATVAIGSRVPVIAAPAMHLSMYSHPAVQRNATALRDMGVELVGPHTDGKKARLATVEEIVEAAIRRIGRNDLRGKRVLIIGGSSEEPLDEVRVVTNASSGETAAQLARLAYERGADVELWTGRVTAPMPSFVPRKGFRTVEDLVGMVEGIDHDVVIVPAALSDYAPEPAAGKIPSGQKEIMVRFRGLPKVLPLIRRRAKVVVGFKAEIDVGNEELERRARERLDEYGLDLIVANDLRDVTAHGTSALLIPAEGAAVSFSGPKWELADRVLDVVTKVGR